MPSRRIREDHKEYRDIVKGNVDDKLKKHIKSGQRISRRGKDFVVVRIPHIELPSFRYGQPSDGGGIGNGEVSEGDEVGEGPQQQGSGEAGQPGEGGEGNGDGHEIDVGISMDTYFDMIGEELQLPNLEPKENGEMVKEKIKWNRIAKVGSNSLLHKKRTLKNALKRIISTEEYDPQDLRNLYPVKEDKEYRSWSSVEMPDTNAAIFFVSDISASMDDEKRALIRELCWYLDNWVQRFYKETQVKYIVHDHSAQEVDQEKFYKYKSGGGTQISSAFHLVNDIIEKAFPLNEWNIYVFYLSDGENFGSDNTLCVEYLQTMQKYANLIGITEVKAVRSWATFLPHIQSQISAQVLDSKKIVTASMNEPSDVFKTLKKLLTPTEDEVPF
jgi:uncharacterized sporulation protein YeaH/YhbH (DUF444 family)